MRKKERGRKKSGVGPRERRATSFYFCLDGIQSKATVYALVVKKGSNTTDSEHVERLNMRAKKSERKENKVRRDEKKGFRKKGHLRKGPRAHARGAFLFSPPRPWSRSRAPSATGEVERARRGSATVRHCAGKDPGFCFDTLLAALVARCRSRVFFISLLQRNLSLRLSNDSPRCSRPCLRTKSAWLAC